MGDEPQSIGDRIRQAREALGWSERELARRARVNISWISRLESGERHNPTLEVAGRIAKALQLHLDYLAFGEEDDIGEMWLAVGQRKAWTAPTPLPG